MNTRATLIATTLGLSLFAAAGIASTAGAAPAKDSAAKTYIVKTKSVLSASGVATDVQAAGGQIKNVYRRVYPGFSAKLTAAQVQELKANPKVDSVIADQAVHATTTQTNPTWGLDRIDQRATTGDDKYRYDTNGSGVTAYILDTGIRLTHHQFGSRAVRGIDLADDDFDDPDCLAGHGTHVSGTVGGSTYGVAKGVKLVDVRVLDCFGSGSFDGVIAGIDWVAVHHSGPSVINMSLGGVAFTALDEAVAAATAAGVTVVVAAGNEDQDACNVSPARAPSAITVGATDDTDTRAGFSNWGPCVDVFAPGVGVLSAWNSGDSDTNYLNGTSMASPHVAGIVARYRQAHPGDSPAKVTAALLAAATPAAVSDPQGSPNLLAYSAPLAGRPGKAVIKTASSGSKSDHSVSVTGRWGQPSSGPVTKYYVTAIRKSNGKKKTVAVSSSVLSKKITGLKKNAKYVVRVYAKNASGNGAVSKTSNTVTAR